VTPVVDAIATAARERGVADPEEDEISFDGTIRRLTLRALDALREFYRQEIGEHSGAISRPVLTLR
jgi:hypothetical protein